MKKQSTWYLLVYEHTNNSVNSRLFLSDDRQDCDGLRKGPGVPAPNPVLPYMTANNDTRPNADNNTDGVPTGAPIIETTNGYGGSSSRRLRRLYAIIELTSYWADSNSALTQDALIPAEQQTFLNASEDWLRYGCERVIQIGGQTTCPPVDKNEQQKEPFNRPTRAGYHQHRSCIDAKTPDGCLVHDLFDDRNRTSRLAQQLVSHQPKQRLLWELTVLSPQPEDLGLLTEAIRYLNSRDVRVPGLGDVRARCINPLYDETEILRKYQRQPPTDRMATKDTQWPEVGENYVAALRDRLAVDGELAPAIYPGDGQ